MLLKGKNVHENKAVAVLTTAFSAVLALVAAAVAAVFAVLLTALGLLSVFVSLGSITGLLQNVATDFAPPAMLFTGLFCLSAAAAIFFGLLVLAPKAVRDFNAAWERRLI